MELDQQSSAAEAPKANLPACCPITFAPFEDPVIASDGQIYERSAIEQVLKGPHPLSPLTREPLDPKVLIPMWRLMGLPKPKAPFGVYGKPLKRNDLPVGALQLITRPSSSLLDPFMKVQCSDPAAIVPIALICVIDVSGSMGDRAGSESSFSKLAVVKHALKTLIVGLGTWDTDHRFSLIEFSTGADTVMPLTCLDSEQKVKEAMRSVDKLKSGGKTAMGFGLSKAFTHLDKLSFTNYQRHILFFTDGEASDKGHDKLITEAEKKHNFTLHTFGFGTYVEVDLLMSLRRNGGGFYFIPEMSMVGTIFINFLANRMMSYTNMYCYKTRKFNLKKTNINRYTPRYIFEEEDVPLALSGSHDIYEEDRFQLLALLQHMLANRGEFDKTKYNFHYVDLYEDLDDPDPNKGQLGKAAKYWDSWGKPYISSIYTLHLVEECGNFKDQAMQQYMYPELKAKIDELNKLYESIPPPMTEDGEEVSPAVYSSLSNNRNTTCFAGWSMVKMTGFSKWKRFDELEPGEILSNGATIKHIIVTHQPGEVYMVEKCGVTPWHPLLTQEGDWVFPRDHFRGYPVRKQEVDVVYNLVLDKHHWVRVGNYIFCTLGHGGKGDVIGHPFFADMEKVEAALKGQSGVCHIKGVVRNPETGLVDGFI
jgi:hypothetical protein